MTEQHPHAWYCASCAACLTFSADFNLEDDSAPCAACGHLNTIVRKECPVCHKLGLGPDGGRVLKCSHCRTVMSDHTWDTWDTLQLACALEASGAQHFKVRERRPDERAKSRD